MHNSVMLNTSTVQAVAASNAMQRIGEGSHERRATSAWGDNIYDPALDAPMPETVGPSCCRTQSRLVGPALRLGRRLMGWALRNSDELWLGYTDNVACVLMDDLGITDKCTCDGVADHVLRRIFR